MPKTAPLPFAVATPEVDSRGAEGLLAAAGAPGWLEAVALLDSPLGGRLVRWALAHRGAANSPSPPASPFTVRFGARCPSCERALALLLSGDHLGHQAEAALALAGSCLHPPP